MGRRSDGRPSLSTDPHILHAGARHRTAANGLRNMGGAGDATGLAVVASLLASGLLFVTGANDVANALGTSVGSGALTVRQACIVAGIFELLGASLVGGSVSSTLGHGITVERAFSGPLAYCSAMFGGLFGSALWVAIATKYSLPVSSTHAIIGSVVSCALIEAGTSAVGGYQLGMTVISWFSSPILGGIIAAGTYFTIRKCVLESASPTRQSIRVAPALMGLTGATLVLFVLIGGPKTIRPQISWWLHTLIFLGLGLFFSGVAWAIVVPMLHRRFELQDRATILGDTARSDDTITDVLNPIDTGISETIATADCPQDAEEHTGSALKQLSPTDNAADATVTDGPRVIDYAERWFGPPMIMTACCVSFAHGGNDIANAIGPLTEILLYAGFGSLDSTNTSELWYVTPLGGVFLVLGLVLWGQNVMKTIGEKITRLTYSKGFAAQFGAAVAVLVATVMGLPISTTAVLVGAIAGVGFSEGANTVDTRLVGKIVIGWIVTLPIAGLFAAAIFAIARAAVGSSSWPAITNTTASPTPSIQ